MKRAPEALTAHLPPDVLAEFVAATNEEDPLPPPHASLSATRRRDDRRAVVPVELPEETPIALEFNGVSAAVMLGSPIDLEDFAVGFALTEGIVERGDEVYGVDVRPGSRGITLAIDIAAAAFVRLKARRRFLAGRSGCGLCGVDSLDQVIRPLPPAFGRGAPIMASAIVRAGAALRDMQPLSRATGATHAAAWCTVGGAVEAVREDIGRHNALDKLVGALARARASTGEGFMLLTSRASTEMVQKAAIAGATTLVAISAPTAAAVRIAIDCGLTLVGFARGDDFTVYAHPERIVG